MKYEKIFVPCSTGADSACLLYNVLSNYEQPVVARMLHHDSDTRQLEKIRDVHKWLSYNVRSFDFNHAEFESGKFINENTCLPNMEYTFGLLAKYHNCDLMITGHNTYNWSQSNWFFQTDDPIEKFYDKDMKFVWTPHYHLRYSWEGPVHWIFMNRETRPIGRWEIWENLPDEMKSIVFALGS